MDAAEGPAKPLGKVLDFMRLIWALDHGLQSLSKRMQASIGLTGPQRVALRVLGRRPGISAGTLANVLRLHPSTLTGILHRLERRGLVRRTRDPEDRRRVRLALTARGRQLDVPTPGTVEAVVKRVLAGIPAERVRPAAEVLAAVAAALLEKPASARHQRAPGPKGRAPVTRR
ncbi:MAG TPA: MarR family transcriptional regulator [Thermoanaerobaculia bacterium]|nr:MarR family transcriptional regulator [Thermoanaerobaculia bacterium]